MSIAKKVTVVGLGALAQWHISHQVVDGEVSVKEWVTEKKSEALAYVKDSWGWAPTATPESSDKPEPILSVEQLIRDESARHHLNPVLVLAVAETESALDPHAMAENPELMSRLKGNPGQRRLLSSAHGLMQVLGLNVGKEFCPMAKHPDDIRGSDAESVRRNVACGAGILRYELEKSKGDVVMALKGYNGGPYCQKHSCPESEAYVRKVLNRILRNFSWQS